MKLLAREKLKKMHSPLYLLGGDGKPLRAYIYIRPKEGVISFGSEDDKFISTRIAITVAPNVSGESLVAVVEYDKVQSVIKDLCGETTFTPEGPVFSGKGKLAMAFLELAFSNIETVPDPIDREALKGAKKH